MKNVKNKSRQPASLHRLSLKSLLVLCAFAACISAHAFEPKALNWKLSATVSNVEFYHAISVCNGNKVVFLKFVNKNSKAVTIAFKEVLETSAGTEDVFGAKKKITIKPGETLAQNCSETTCMDCMVLPERAIPTHKVDVQQFQFKEIEVTP